MSNLTYKQQIVIALLSNNEFVAQSKNTHRGIKIGYAVSKEVKTVIDELGCVDKDKTND